MIGNLTDESINSMLEKNENVTEYYGEMTAEDRRDQIEEHCEPDDDVPAVWCGTYHKYNCGFLDGRWIDLTSFADYEEFRAFLHLLHADEADPEFMFNDFQNFPEEWYSEGSLDEETFDAIQEYAQMDEDKRDIYEAFTQTSFYDKTKKFDEDWENYYAGEDIDAESLGWDMAKEMGLPEWAEFYFNFKQYGETFLEDYQEVDGYWFREW